jgi:hypothetical protein
MSELFFHADLLDLDITPLVICYKSVTKLFSFFNSVEVIDNHTHKKINDKLTTDDHEGYKIDYKPGVVVLLGLHVNANAIDSVVHYICPTFGGSHLKESAHRLKTIIKV